MADVRGRIGVKIIDPTTNASEAAVASLTDNFANPIGLAVGAFGMVWDGATWDRAPGNSASGQFIQGDVAHDAPVAANPLLIGARASAAAPTDVSADGDAVRAWFLRNGAQATVVTAAGALIGGDATNGLDVDVTRVTGTVTVDSELPTAAALSDTTANPTAPMVGSAGMLWDGSTNWIRAKSAATLADALANPGAGLAQGQSFLMGYNGSTWDRVRTANTGRLQVDVVTGGGTPSNVFTDNGTGFTDGTSTVGAVGFLFDEAAGTALTENDIAAGRIDSKRAQVHVIEDATTRGQRMSVDASGRITSNINGTVTVDSELPTAAALADATANPTVPGVGAFALGYNGTTWDRVRTANTGRLQVDVITGGGSNTPTSPQKVRVTSAAVSAGSSANLDSTQVTSAKTAKLWQILATASVAIKVDIQTMLNGTGTTVATFFVQPNQAYTYNTPHPNFITQAESVTAGLDGFRAIVTNMDNASAADVYATFFWEEV